MYRRITLSIAAVLALIAAVVAQVAFAGRENAAGSAAVPVRLAGPWYTPQERRALTVYANASFAQKQAIVSGATRSAAGAATDLGAAGDLHEGIGQADLKTFLETGSVYTASRFPVALNIHPPDAHWGGVQLESGDYRFVQLARLHVPGTPPFAGTGFLTLESARVATPSVAKTLANLRRTPNVSAGPIGSMRVGGLQARFFDATITGVDRSKYCQADASKCSPGISLAPFTTNHHCGFCTNTMHRETQDVKYAGKGQVFRIVVLDVHGKTVVIYLESNYPDQRKFPPTKVLPTFLPYAQKLLAGISFS